MARTTRCSALRPVLATGVLALAALPMSGYTFDYAGHWSGELDGQPARADLVVDSDAIRGTLDISGYVYRLQARHHGSAAEGQMTDEDGRSVAMRMQSGNDRLTVLVQAVPGDPQATLQIDLARSGGTVAGPLARGSAAPTSAAPTAPAEPVELDPVLVGGWVQRDSYTSGDFSMSNEKRVALFPDGSYRFGPGRVIGGGDAGSFDSGSGGGGDGGRWRTRDRILYTMEGGAGWQPYGRYYVEGNRLLITFGDGSRELWYRE